MTGDDEGPADSPKPPAADVRCQCGARVARRTPNGIELYCRRCRRPVIHPSREALTSEQ